MSANIQVFSELPEDEPSFDIRGDAVRALAAAEQAHFWHLTRNRILADRLFSMGARPPARILELGCGGGCVTAHLAGLGYDVVGVEGHRRLLEMAASRAPNAGFWLHDLRRGTGELPARDFEVAALFDVIEHLEDPLATLNDAVRCIRPGGLVVGTVPALMSLWSEVDERAGHKTRYSQSSLRALLGRVANAKIVEIAPFNRTLVPLLWLQRRLFAQRSTGAATSSNLSIPPWPLNQALHRLVMAEHRLAPWLDRTPIEGASLWFALRKV